MKNSIVALAKFNALILKVFAAGLICFLNWTDCYGETVSGKVIDENGQPLPYANVVLMSLPDSAFVSGTISDEDGTFTLETTSENQVVKISSIGYKTICKPVTPANIGMVRLVPDTQQLGEVVVKADLPKTRVKGDAMVTTVTGSVLETAGTGNDLLDKIPGLSADNGSVNVFGSGEAEIYINGRKVRDGSELDRLSSDNIKRVEVLRNPGSRYDASVKAVVRIVTKKPQGEGFGFNNRAYAGYRYDWHLLDQFDFNYRKGGFDLGGMLFGMDNRYEDNKSLVQRTYLDKTWEQNSVIRHPYHARNVAAMLSMNYQFNENHIMGLRYDFDRDPQIKQTTNLETSVYKDNELEEKSDNNSFSNRIRNEHKVNAYYNGKIRDWSVDFNADGMWNDSKLPSFTEELVASADGTESIRTLNTLDKTENKLYAAKLVAERPLWSGNLSVGSEYSYSYIKNRYTNEEGIIDNNSNDINENAVSAFVEYARTFGKLRTQIGVRYEHLNSVYYKDEMKVDDQSRIYDNVFPSIALSYPAGNVQLMLSYAGNIDRPSYYKLSGGVAYANRYTYEGGNPLLRPAVSNVLSFNASWKWIYLNVNYIHSNDVQVKVSRAYSETDPTISLLTYENVPDADKMNVMFSMSPTIGVWSPQFSAMYAQQWFMVDTPEGRVNFNNPIGLFKWNNTFSLPEGFQLRLDMLVSTRGETETLRMLKPYGSVDVSVYKGFMDDRLTFQLQANDLLDTSAPDVAMFSGNRVLSAFQESRRSFSITMRYKFNAAKSKYKGTGAGESQKSRM